MSVNNDVKKAVDAMVNLNMFAAIKELTENGLLRGGNNAAAKKISDICNKEQQRQLKLYDESISRINHDN